MPDAKQTPLVRRIASAELRPNAEQLFMPDFPDAFKNPFHEGAIAQRLGADQFDNPYLPHSSEFRSWTNGWRAAHDFGTTRTTLSIPNLDQSIAELPSHVLIVCDNVPARERMAEYLAAAGCQSIEAADTDFALELLVRRPEIKAIVISAEQRSFLDGAELAEVVVKRWPEISRVVVVGTGDPPAGKIPRGATYLSRPVAPSAMLDVLLKRVDPAT